MTNETDPIEIIRAPISRQHLKAVAELRFGDMVKAVVDIRRGLVAIGGELHADEEHILLSDGSAQDDLWGINLYPDVRDASWLEFDSMINLRPSKGNRSRSVDDPAVQDTIRGIVDAFVVEA